MENSNLGYTNYVIGSVKAITESLSIILYNKASFSTRISLYNLSSFYLNYLSGPNSSSHVRLGRNDFTESFEYNKDLDNGFDVIVYISSSLNTPVGYTEFNNLQGIGVYINIDLDFKRSSSESSSIYIDTSVYMSGNSIAKNLGGENLDQYTRVSDLPKSYQNPYTTNLERLETDPTSYIVSRNIIISNGDYRKLGIARNINVDPYDIGFTKHDICFYNGDLVIVSWNETKYGVVSLTRTNSFGLPVTYVKPGTELIEEIESLGSRYYYSKSGKLIDLVTREEYIGSFKDNILVSDKHDSSGIVYELPTFFQKKDVLEYIPEINNIYLDLDYYFESYQLTIYRKIGSWFILRQKYSGKYLYFAISPVCAVYFDYSDLENLMFVNDQTIILKEDDYYMIYNRPGEIYYSEKARLIVEGGKLNDYDGTGILMCITGDTNIDEAHYQKYYGSQKISVVFKYEDLYKTKLNSYRRGIYPNQSEIPELVCSVGGLIFYKTDSIINYI